MRLCEESMQIPYNNCNVLHRTGNEMCNGPPNQGNKWTKVVTQGLCCILILGICTLCGKNASWVLETTSLLSALCVPNAVHVSVSAHDVVSFGALWRPLSTEDSLQTLFLMMSVEIVDLKGPQPASSTRSETTKRTTCCLPFFVDC